jgi:hypothetical protein
VPAVKRPPSEYLKEQLWITTQPMEEPADPADLIRTMEWIGWDRLLFATDYPHWDFDDPMRALPRGLDPRQRRQLQAENARKLFARALGDAAPHRGDGERDPGRRAQAGRHQQSADHRLSRQGRIFRPLRPLPACGGSFFAGKLTGLVESDGPGHYCLKRQGEIIRCPWHGWEFDLRTGRSHCDPRRIRARCYETGVSSADELKATTFPVEHDEAYVFVEV